MIEFWPTRRPAVDLTPYLAWPQNGYHVNLYGTKFTIEVEYDFGNTYDAPMNLVTVYTCIKCKEKMDKNATADHYGVMCYNPYEEGY